MHMSANITTTRSHYSPKRLNRRTYGLERYICRLHCCDTVHRFNCKHNVQQPTANAAQNSNISLHTERVFTKRYMRNLVYSQLIRTIPAITYDNCCCARRKKIRINVATINRTANAMLTALYSMALHGLFRFSLTTTPANRRI